MKFIILGCGSSMGVPRPDGFFGNCDPNNKKNYRTRCSALIKTTDENILIDTSPDLRQQLLKHKIKKINKVLFSHMHGDQTHGINDLRSFYINSRKQLNVYADKHTSIYLSNTFSYVFKFLSSKPFWLKHLLGSHFGSSICSGLRAFSSRSRICFYLLVIAFCHHAKRRSR